MGMDRAPALRRFQKPMTSVMGSSRFPGYFELVVVIVRVAKEVATLVSTAGHLILKVKNPGLDAEAVWHVFDWTT